MTATLLVGLRVLRLSRRSLTSIHHMDPLCDGSPMVHLQKKRCRSTCRRNDALEHLGARDSIARPSAQRPAVALRNPLFHTARPLCMHTLCATVAVTSAGRDHVTVYHVTSDLCWAPIPEASFE